MNTPSEGIKISELTARGNPSASDQDVSINGTNSYNSEKYNTVFNITTAMTDQEMQDAIYEASYIRGKTVYVQLADGTYDMPSDLDFLDCDRLIILGNSNDSGSGSGKSVVINFSGPVMTFTNCHSIEFRYIEINDTSTTRLFDLTNSRVNVLDCYIANNNQTGALARVNKGGHFYIQDSTNDNYFYVGEVNGGIWEYATGNTSSNAYGDPYFSVSSGFVIDHVGSLINSDFNSSYEYNSFGGNISASTIRALTITSLGTSNNTNLSISPAENLNLEAGTGSVFSNKIRDDTTASAANMRCDPVTGVLQRSTSTETIKINKKFIYATDDKKIKALQDFTRIAKEACLVFNSIATADNKDKEFIGFSADKLKDINESLVQLKTHEVDGFIKEPVLDKDNNLVLDDVTKQPLTRQKIKYVELENPIAAGVELNSLISILYIKLQDVDERLKSLEGAK